MRVRMFCSGVALSSACSVTDSPVVVCLVATKISVRRSARNTMGVFWSVQAFWWGLMGFFFGWRFWKTVRGREPACVLYVSELPTKTSWSFLMWSFVTAGHRMGRPITVGNIPRVIFITMVVCTFIHYCLGLFLHQQSQLKNFSARVSIEKLTFSSSCAPR